MRKPASTTRTLRPCIIAATLFVLLAGALPEASAALRAGVAAVNITADKPEQPVRDPLQAKALVLEDGANKVVFISLDVVVVAERLVADIRTGVQKELGIDPAAVLVNASHNHDTCDAIVKDLAPQIVRAVKQASQNMAPARIGVGVGREDRITMNRRLRMKDDTPWTIRRATPSPKDADVAGLGPIDPQIGLLRVDTAAGKPLALLYNFAGHAYCGTPGGGISTDFPGYASRVIEEAWPGAVALFVQGAAGDVTPIQYKDFDAPPPTEQLGARLGASALKAAQGISTTSQGSVRVLSETIALPRRTDLTQRIQALTAQQDKLLEALIKPGCGSHGAGVALNFKSFLPLYMKYAVDAERPANDLYAYQQEASAGQNGLRQLDEDNKKRVDAYRECIENMDRLITVRTNIHILQEQLDKHLTGPIAAEIQAVRIGDFVLVAFPGEAFAEVGLRIKKQSPFPKTFVAGYTNGWIGYAPTADCYTKDAAYEDALTQLAPEWQEIFERKALEMIARLGK